MKPIYFVIVCAIMTHPNKLAIIKLRHEKGI